MSTRWPGSWRHCRVSRRFWPRRQCWPCRVAPNLKIGDTDLDGISDVAEEHRIDLVVVGPEAPLVVRLVDALSARGIAAFGPTQRAAQIESSKWFAKSIMQSGPLLAMGAC